MAASAKSLPVTLRNHAVDGEWTIVATRKGKQRKHVLRGRTLEGPAAWVPVDADTNPERVSKLLQKMGASLKRMERSLFYHNFLEQLQNEEVSKSFSLVLGSEVKMPMVVYGIGSIESYETPRLQLSLVLLMKRKFKWVGDIEIFDPILSATESHALKALGCSVLSINEQGRRCALGPTLFYMPHCGAELYDNLLSANWSASKLGHIALFGNSFEKYAENAEFSHFPRIHSARHILAARKFTDQFEIPACDSEGEFFRAFNDSSWHFFSNVCDTELPFVNP